MATARRGLKHGDMSPASADEATSQNILRRTTSKTKNKNLSRSSNHLYDQSGDHSDDSCDISQEDETDCNPNHSPRIYPHLADFDESSNGEYNGELSYKGVAVNNKKSPKFNDKYNKLSPSPKDKCILRKPTDSPSEVKTSPPRKPKDVYPDLHEGPDHSSQRGLSPALMIGFVGIVIIVMLIIGQVVTNIDANPKPSHEKRTIHEIYQDLKSDLGNLFHKLPLTKHTWTQIIGQLSSMMTESPRQPAVITVVVPKGAQKTATCFIHRLALAVSHAFKDTKWMMFDVVSHMDNDIDTLKYELSDTFSGLSDTHAAVIHNIEKLPPQASLILHGFCDNDNAPHKQALILLTLEIEMHFENLLIENLDRVIDKLLMDSWADPYKANTLRVDDVSAVIARIATAPIIINPLSSDIVDDVCPNT